MTNNEIILSNRVFLMENGVIKGTGERFIFSDEHGTREIEMPEEIHTFNEWKKLGYIVKKGEHSIARFPIWQMSKKKKKGENEKPQQGQQEQQGQQNEQEQADGDKHYYKKVAFFFTLGQTEPATK